METFNLIYISARQVLKSVNIKKIFLNLIRIVAIIAAASIIGFLFRFMGFVETNIVIVYLLAVLIIAWITYDILLGIVASILATVAFNYFFTQPYYTLMVYDPSYIVTFIIMAITAIITSTLTSHAKKSEIEAKQKEAQTKAVYNLTNNLMDAQDIDDIASFAVSSISNCFFCKAAFICFDEQGNPEKSFIQQISDDKQIHRQVEDISEIKLKMEQLKSDYSIGQEFYDFPIRGREGLLGAVRVPKEKAQKMNETQMLLLISMIESICLAMERFWSAYQRIRLYEETIQQRYRSNLLRAISHDLRTPLSGIMGTSEIILGMTDKKNPCYVLAEEIYSDADWLHSLVENILNLTRLQDGKLILNKQLEAVEEVIGSAVNHIAKRAPKYEIEVCIPDEILLVSMDAKLIEQVLINLLDNAVRHTTPENEIKLTVIKDIINDIAVFTVKDRGCGIAVADLPYVFDMFYTSKSKSADAGYGIGLGLAICDAIIKAHGGDIEAKNNSDGKGAEFMFTLRLEENNNK